MTVRRLAVCLLLLAALLSACRLMAQCTITVTSVAFGSYDVFDPVPTDSTGSLAWSCSQPDLTVRIELGPGASGSFRPRQMTGGAERLAYNLYLDPAATRIWGDGSGGTFVYSAVSGGGPQRAVSVPIYGVIPPGQDARPGVYTDDVVVTVVF